MYVLYQGRTVVGRGAIAKSQVPEREIVQGDIVFSKHEYYKLDSLARVERLEQSWNTTSRA